ncbi:MAG: TolC family protein [Verrucomicrobiales bacterium]|nr:TolC family protein [Verrucomicrobiales bacterium]
MRSYFTLLLPIALVLSVPPQAAEARSLSRNEAIALALANDRELSIAALEIERAASSFRWAGRLDNPELEVSRGGDGIGLDDGESNYEVAFSQRFPITSRLKKEKGLKKYEVLLAEAEIAERRREIAGEVDQAIVDLLATREQIRLERKLLALNREIVDFLKQQQKRGEVSSLDVMQATLTGRKLEQAAKGQDAVERQKLFALNKLLGIEATSSVTITENLKLPGSAPANEADFSTVLGRRPDYVLALAKIDEANAAIALEEASRWEDISVKLFVEGENAVDDPNGLERNSFAGFGISIPLPLRKRNQEGIERAKIDRRAAGKGVESAAFTIRSECEDAFQQRKDAWELATEASGELLNLAEQNLKEFRKAYQEGQASLIQVQQAQEQVLELQNASVEFTAEYHRAAARVRFVTGNYPNLTISNSSK